MFRRAVVFTVSQTLSFTFPLYHKHGVAYHEGGHALVAATMPDVDPVYKVTIVPRGRSLGVTQFQPEGDRRNIPRKYLLEQADLALIAKKRKAL
jgi:ATP-dependent Zn protease